MEPTATPTVSTIIPVRNEEKYIGRCLESLMLQDYPLARMEVLVVDGHSTDQSVRTVERYSGGQPRVRLLDNPDQVTPAAFNIGVRNSNGHVVIILGSHSYVEPDFIRCNVETLERTGAQCVGGRIETINRTIMGRVISVAMSSTFGVGNARFRTSNKPGFVDTVAFGAYRRDVFDTIGYFDEKMVKNQDDEFNFRLTKAGGKIFLDPSIRSYYWSRSTLKTLWQQYFQYGRWKIRILRKHGSLPSRRHLVPAMALLFYTASVSAVIAYPALVWLPLTLLALYLGTSFLFAFRLCHKLGFLCLLLPAAFAVLHLSYAMGFLCGLTDYFSNRPRRS